MVRLVPVVEQTLVACLAASVGRTILKRVGVVVADRERSSRKGGQHRRVFDESAEDTGTAFRHLMEEDLQAVPARWHGLARKLSRLELELLLNRLLERRLEARSLRAGAGRLEAHDQGVLGVPDEWDHAHDAPFGRRVVLVGGIRLVA